MTENQQKIQELLSHASAGISMCQAAYTIIDEATAEEKPGLFEDFTAGFEHTLTDNTMKLPKFMSTAEANRLSKKYLLHVDAHMVALMDLNLPKADFYKKLWTYISASPSLPTLKARVFALYSCVSDIRLPYYPIDRTTALKMSLEDFEKHTVALGDEMLGRMQYLLCTAFETRPEQASLLLREMDSLDSFEARTVYLTHFIAYFTENPGKQRQRDLLALLGRNFSLSDLFAACEDDCIEDDEET